MSFEPPFIPRTPSMQEMLEGLLAKYSASEFVQVIATSLEFAKRGLPADRDCVLEMLLENGEVLQISRISAEGTSALRVEGIRANETCLIFCHYSALKLLCSFPSKSGASRKPKIGFFVDGKEVIPVAPENQGTQSPP
jgi:hypothetical protein